MDMRRVVLYAFLAFIVYSLWMKWQEDYPRPLPTQSTTTISKQPRLVITKDNQTIPLFEDKSDSEKVKEEDAIPAANTSAPLIQVKTDVLSLMIDASHGNIIQAQLLDYPVSVEQKDTPFTLLNNGSEQRYVANSLLLSKDGQVESNLNFTAQQSSYELSSDQEELRVVLQGKDSAGVDVNKVFTFKRGSYLINVSYELQNASGSDWKGYVSTQLMRANPAEDKSSVFHVGSYTGASYSNPGQQRYKKVSFADMKKNDLNVESNGGWIAMQQHYFLSAWVPNADSKNLFYSRVQDDDFTIGSVSQPIVLKAGEKTTVGNRLYIGPEITSDLKAIAPGLDLTVDYGWLWFLSSILFSVMKAIYAFVGNWGWSIVLVTMLIKLAFYRLSATSYRSMAGMRKLQPKLLELRERYGDDKAKMSQATMELYRQEKVNPLGGCLPIIVQIPVFIALYWVLLESVELRQAPFIFWIKDLAAPDPYHVLPIIMGITMLIQQRLNPAPPDPMQARVMMFLPVLFTGLFWNFPSGLVLYWIVNNTLSILQQWYITRKYGETPPVQKKLSVAK